MKIRTVASAFVLLVALLNSSGCGRGINQAKFEGVYRAGQGMKSATDVGVTIVKYRELLQVFASEVAMAEAKPANAREKAMVANFTEALVNYRDAATLWAAKIDTRNAAIPTTTIPEGPGIVDKYGLVTDLGDHPDYRTFSPEAGMQIVWVRAAQNIALANAAYTGKS
jgi:hypothetical protein